MKTKQQSAVIWLTGLSGAGKTTIANVLAEKLKAKAILPVLLDGDEIRNAIQQHGFEEESRKKHNLNIGNLAAMFEKQGHIVIVSLISPYADVRKEIRENCKKFIEVYVSTDLKTCQARDTKGLYKKAMNGEILNFTGISAPYEVPPNPELILDTNLKTCEACVAEILVFYEKNNIINQQKI